MVRVTVSVSACILAFAAASATARTRADDRPPTEVLRARGLRAMGPLYVLDGEAEAKQRHQEYRLITRKLEQAMIQNINAQIGRIRGEINTVGQRIGRTPRYRGRFANMYARQQQAEFSAYRNELNAALRQQTAFLNQVKSQKLDPKQKDRIDAEVKSLRDQRVMAARELEMTVRTTREKYADLATDAGVQKALVSLGLTIKPSPHLGPSHEFHEIARFADRLEKDVTDGSPVQSKSKNRHGAK